jgi:hypothetical protein
MLNLLPMALFVLREQHPYLPEPDDRSHDPARPKVL